MWIRPSIAHTARFHQLHRAHRRVRQPPSTHSAATHCESVCAFFATRELVDDVQLTIGTAPQHGSSSPTDNESNAVWVPFQSLSLAYAMHPALRTIATSHATLFASLTKTPDVLQHLITRNPCGGHVGATRLRCVRATFTAVEPYRSDVRRLLALPPHSRHLVEDIRLVQLLFRPSPNTCVLVAKALEHARGASSSEALWTLLSVPCPPEVLHAVLAAALRACPAGLTPHVFQRVVHALLNNDNFFCERTLPEMHGLLLDVVLPAVGKGEQAFDAVAVRWTPLMNKWARVYTKGGKGFLLYDCLCALLRAAPVAETKLPASFYVRLLGAVLDASVVDGCPDPALGWTKIKAVARDALRLFGRNATDMRAVWVLLMKGALTLPPLRADYQRLLEAYHLCVKCGHPTPLDRQGFLQVTRLVEAAIGALAATEVVSVVHEYCIFMQEQGSASFLWLLDGVGSILTDLWDTHGAAAGSQAQEVLTTLEKLLRDRRVTGVDIYANPVIARALDHFQLGGAVQFWWRCGCGEELPGTSKRCTACLRTSGLSWRCPACAQPHKVPCEGQPCACGTPNPRLTAATRAGRAICPRCGDVMDGDGACARCEEQRNAQSRAVACAHCHKSYKANALHCPHCYAANPAKPPLYLWHCGECDDFNYSIWSSCRTCKAPRRAGALFVPFVPWTCGCGALNHPGRLTCSHCGTGARHHTFTCVGCYAPVSIKSLRRVAVRIDETTIPLHLCPHCHATHPRSDLLLYSPLLPRHCMFCAERIPSSSVASHGAFHHCGTVQGVNENYVFRCTHCPAGEQQQPELQTGYHCKHCLFPRPEVEALMVAAEADRAMAPITSVWRCLHESEEGELCGQWNYGWSAHCAECGTGRPVSAFECRAKAQLWRCETCGQANRPIDVLFCPQCKGGLQPVQPCSTCGLPHLTYACRVHME